MKKGLPLSVKMEHLRDLWRINHQRRLELYTKRRFILFRFLDYFTSAKHVIRQHRLAREYAKSPGVAYFYGMKYYR